MRDPKSVPGGAGGEVGGAAAPRSRGLDVRFAAGADAAVARRLKEMYDGLVSEPVPDRFLDLLSQLEQAETPATAASETAPTKASAGDGNPVGGGEGSDRGSAA